ncbi:MAG TPA: hypothetical protein VKS81_01610 [Bacteroidota bacterium]|nr:hypothetical protein [Bacteroidota bacterium]
MSSTFTFAIDAQPVTATEQQWLRSRRWDLTFVSLSAVLVAVPILTYMFANQATSSINAVLAAVGIHYTWDDDASRNLVNGLIALFIGGPHMYATYTRTALDSGFTHKHKLFMGLSLLIPVGVIILGVNYFQLLITFFFFWASIHIMHQMAFIMECYNKKAKSTLTPMSRIIDYSVVFSSLYPIATYKFVHEEFWIGSNKIFFPEFLKTDYLFYFVSAFFAAAVIMFIWKTVNEIREGTVNYPKVLLMSLTVVVAFFIPAFKNLDVAFQGFNAWHSFQYLGLTYYINTLRHERGEIGTKFIDHMSESGKSWRYYFFNVGLTLMAVSVIAVLIYFKSSLGLSFDQCYYIVVLSFLLMHYLHDHLLFTHPEVIVSA